MKIYLTTPIQSKQQGITLVELMVAMVIGLILTAGILQLFVANKQTHRVTENMSRLQENGRFAMHFIGRDIRMADFWGCRGESIEINNNLNADPIYDTFNAAVAGIDNDANSTNNIIDGTDTITLKGALGAGVSISASTFTSFTVPANSGLGQNDKVLVSNCINGDIFQIIGDPTAGNVAIAAGGPGTGNATGVFSRLYDTNSQIYKLNFATYLIRNGANGQPALFRSINGGTPQELVENIEDMQIQYGEDTNDDDSADFYRPASAVNMNNVVSVRISIVAVTPEDNVTDQANNYNIFGTSITSPDNRVRRVLTSTYVIRNRLP